MLDTAVGLSRGHERISCYVGHSKELPKSFPNRLVARSVVAAKALACAVENTMAFGFCASSAI
jgi:hypothetical protein